MIRKTRTKDLVIMPKKKKQQNNKKLRRDWPTGNQRLAAASLRGQKAPRRTNTIPLSPVTRITFLSTQHVYPASYPSYLPSIQIYFCRKAYGISYGSIFYTYDRPHFQILLYGNGIHQVFQIWSWHCYTSLYIQSQVLSHTDMQNLSHYQKPVSILCVRYLMLHWYQHSSMDGETAANFLSCPSVIR